MRTEPITEDTIAEVRMHAMAQPAAGLPRLARSLLQFGWQVDRASPSKRIPYFEEAAAIYRRLVTDGTEEHLGAAMQAIASLGQQYSLVHADSLALAARHEAAALARRVNSHREGGTQESKILADLAHGLAECGQFAQAATVEREVVDIYRAAVSRGGYELSSLLAWSLLDLAIFLDLAGQGEASLAIDHEALALQRRVTETDPDRQLPTLAIWTAGASLRLAGSGHPRQARELLRESIAACDQLPAEGERGNFRFLQAVHAAHFARSGVHDEQPDADGVTPIGVHPDQSLQPVFGLSFHHWSFSVRHAYRKGLAAIGEAIIARSKLSPGDPARLAELGTLVRRRNIRASVLSGFEYRTGHYPDVLIPALAHGVALERLLLAADPIRGPQRLVRALTDHAAACLTVSANANAANILREAHALYMTIDNRSH
ncbi:tetratricopeptide repeat protein [Amycolatopsis sp. NPDC059657]|uniref:tetratricopeptide repeat protein n=1 Tax=Amycolatopsis sp. NPDC059657 TaxID=3346899 RepID=UPI00367001A2